MAHDSDRKIGIPVHVADASVVLPPAKRDPDRLFLAELRRRLRAQMKKDVGHSTFLRRNGVTFTELEKDSIVERAGRLSVLAAGGEKTLARFDAKMAGLRKAGHQWDIDELMTSLQSAVRPFARPNVYFMGVTNLDVFADDGNFVFGTACRGCSVISYRRFTADFYGMPPDPQRLTDRTYKQALSSLGFMLGVSRCTSPTCPRAYPHHLAEHDAKSTELCHECRTAFQGLLHRYAGTREDRCPPGAGGPQ